MMLPLENVLALAAACLLIGFWVGRRLRKGSGLETPNPDPQESTDALTGLATRETFDEEIERRMVEWQRQESPVSVMLVDMDRFRRFNDNHGHPAGDQLLRSVADSLVGAMRTIDLVARFGGEEMAVIMPHTNWQEAVLAAERARVAIEKTRIESRGKMLGVTVSVGMADILPSDNAASLVQRADEALRASKGAGRNLTHRHDGDSPVLVRAVANKTGDQQGDGSEPVVSQWPDMADR